MSIAIMTQMVTRCLTMDNHATRLYLNLSHQAADDALKSFWQDIAEKNERHVHC